MKIQVLWVQPSERRFGSGDILTRAELEEFGMDVDEMLGAKEAQILDPLDHDGNGAKGGSRPRKKAAG